MPPDPSNISFTFIVVVTIFALLWLYNHLLNTLEESRKNNTKVAPGTIDRLFYSHLKYGNTLGWTITHSHTEPKKRKTYISRLD